MEIDELKLSETIKSLCNDEQLGFAESIEKPSQTIIVDGDIYEVSIKIKKLI